MYGRKRRSIDSQDVEAERILEGLRHVSASTRGSVKPSSKSPDEASKHCSAADLTSQQLSDKFTD